jgi:hypothetical protein
MSLRTFHRWTMTIAALFLVYVAGTGVIIQLIDMKSLYTHAPASDPTMQSIREGIMGPPGFAVISTADYTAARLPVKADLGQLVATVQKAARAVVRSEALSWVELRMDGNTPVGIVAVSGANAHRLKFNALTGEAMGSAESESPFAMFNHGPPSPHDVMKGLHRGDFIGHVGAWISLLVSLLLVTMVISGLTLYFNMLANRQKSGRPGWFWR